MTKLERFLRSNRVPPMALVRESGVSRRYLFYLRLGKSQPSLSYAKAVARACSALTGESVDPEDLFAIRDPRRKAS